MLNADDTADMAAFATSLEQLQQAVKERAGGAGWELGLSEGFDHIARTLKEMGGRSVKPCSPSPIVLPFAVLRALHLHPQSSSGSLKVPVSQLQLADANLNEETLAALCSQA